jgi:3-ketosteroid 9alpha-monooxygenase subunit A
MGRFPVPGLAVGWFQVAYADDLPPGAVRPVRYFGRDLVLWRDADGRPVLTGAHCPHLGAHLGYGGTVTEAGLRCPLHGWLFDAGGRCAAVPDGPLPGPSVALRAYPTVERNSLVLAWFHPGGQPPAWRIPESAEIAGGTFVPLARHAWSAPTIWQEVAESMMDVTHVSTLHGLAPYDRYEVTEDGPRRRLHMVQRLRTHLGDVELAMDFEVHGPGYVIARIGANLILMQTFSPVEEERLDIRFTFFGRDLGSPRRTERIGAALVDDLVRQTEQHLPVWSHKAYVADPPAGADIDTIRRFRAWAAQFHVR